MSGRVLHFGKYEGCEVERVLEIDPEYLIWAVENVKGHGISQKAVADARAALDQNDGDDWENFPQEEAVYGYDQDGAW